MLKHVNQSEVTNSIQYNTTNGQRPQLWILFLGGCVAAAAAAVGVDCLVFFLYILVNVYRYAW